MTGLVYKIKWTPTASRLLVAISDQRIQGVLLDRADKLAKAPEQQGKPLLGELTGFRSVRVEHERYRLIYHVQRETVVVAVVAVGLRKHGAAKDVYTLAQKLIRQGLIVPVRKARKKK